MSDMIKIKVSISTNRVGSECVDYLELLREEWDAMSEEEQEDIRRDVAFNVIDWHWEEVE
jgi:hypothetical protein